MTEPAPDFDAVPPGSTARTTIRRVPDRAVHNISMRDAILDAGLVAHVAVVEAGQPFVVPVAYARCGDEVVFHGSSASRLFKTLAHGNATCLTVTLLDGLVLARSAYESSMNYRSVMVIGTPRILEGAEEQDALRCISDHLLPERWDDIRPPSAQETKATIVLALSLAECSVKVRAGPPDDLAEDLTDPTYGPSWAGTIPITESFGVPEPDDLSRQTAVPRYIESWRRS